MARFPSKARFFGVWYFCHTSPLSQQQKQLDSRAKLMFWEVWYF